MRSHQSDPLPSSRATRRPDDPVWVIATADSPAVHVANRLGVPYRRLTPRWTPLAWPACLPALGSLAGIDPTSLPPTLFDTAPPRLVITADQRAAAVALWLRQRFGSIIVHCTRPLLHGARFDLLAIQSHRYPGEDANVLPILGPLHPLSPQILKDAEYAWSDRLSHLPSPRLVLAVGGHPWLGEMQPAIAHRLARDTAARANRAGGSVLAIISRRTGTEAGDALAAGLAAASNLVYRVGEPGSDPTPGFLAMADAVIVTADWLDLATRACAGPAPVFLTLPELAAPWSRTALADLREAGMVRWLRRNALQPWERPILDESGRLATEIRRRFPLE